MSRRIVQIETSYSRTTPGGTAVNHLYALCDDGTLWMRSDKGLVTLTAWALQENVPQHQVPDYEGPQVHYPIHPTD